VVDAVVLVDVVDAVVLVDVVDAVVLVDVVDAVVLVDVVDAVVLVDVVDAVVLVAVAAAGAGAPVDDIIGDGGVAPAAPGVAKLLLPAPWAWRKTTVSDPVLARCWTCTSATNPCGSPHGSAPPGPAVPAT
jgi:hypothetical protein